MGTKPIAIPISMVRNSLDGAFANGLDVDRLLKACGVDPIVLNDPDASLSVSEFARLNVLTKEAMRDEAYGLLEKPVPVGATRVMTINMVHAKTLGGAFERFIEFNSILKNSFEYHMETSSGQTRFFIRRRKGWKVQNSFAIESCFAFPHRFIGWLANERILLSQMSFDYSPPIYVGDYRQIFYCAPCVFDQESSFMQFDSIYLSHPIVQSEASLEVYLRRMPLDNYLPLEAGGEATLAVRDKVSTKILNSEDLPDFDQLAEEMAFHPQALRRKLKSEGTHYSAIRVQARRDIATHLLGQGKLSVAEVGYRVGYTETSAFIRAFKGWTGLTPLKFRNGYRS